MHKETTVVSCSRQARKDCASLPSRGSSARWENSLVTRSCKPWRRSTMPERGREGHSLGQPYRARASSANNAGTALDVGLKRSPTSVLFPALLQSYFDKRGRVLPLLHRPARTCCPLERIVSSVLYCTVLYSGTACRNVCLFVAKVDGRYQLRQDKQRRAKLGSNESSSRASQTLQDTAARPRALSPFSISVAAFGLTGARSFGLQ